MWTGQLPVSALRDRWSIDPEAAPRPDRPASAFPLVAVRELVVERRESIDPQATPDEMFNYLGLENVRSLTGDLVGLAPRPGRSVRSRSKVFREGDVLYGRLRPSLNKVYLAEEPVSSGICSGEFLVLIPRAGRIGPHLLRALLASDAVLRVASSLPTGSALPRLQRDDLLDLAVPVPPVERQADFEAFLIEQARRRRRLAAELAAHPGRTMEALARALETGEAPAARGAV